MAHLIDLTTFTDKRGNLTVIEKGIPFDIKRIFYIYGVDESVRGGHRHHTTTQAAICIQGSCTIRNNDNSKTEEFILNKPSQCLILNPEDWHQMYNFSPDAILMVSDSLTMLNRKRVFDYAAAHRLPAIYEFDSLVHEGGLMSYGADLKESFERAAAKVDRIFQGAKPGDLPFEQPTRYLFVINLKTAKSIGLEIPPTLLALADEVIE